MKPGTAEIFLAEERKALERGKEIWFSPETGNNNKTCETCHPKGEMTGAEAYPRYKHILRTMATLSMTHNFAVVNEMKGRQWELGSYDANALVLFVTSMANGKQMNMAWPKGIKDEWISRGRSIFIGSFPGAGNKSCQSCHLQGGKKANGGDNIPALDCTAANSPKYSFAQNAVVTLEQQINYCIEHHLQVPPLPLDDTTIVALCCYLTCLSEGKKVAVAQVDNRGK